MADKNAKKLAHDNTTVVDIAGGKKSAAKKKPEKKKGEKRKSKLPLVIFIICLILVIAAFLFSHFYYDLFGWKAPMFDLMHHLDPDFVEIVDREATLEARAETLNALEASLNEREDSLNEWELRLSRFDEELKRTEKSRTPVYRPPINDSDREYMTGIAKIYAGMEPENAAEVMVNLYSVEDMAAIVYFMSSSKAASILECMNPSLAAQITDQLLNTYS